MISKRNRRDFLKIAFVSGSVIPICFHRILARQAKETPEAALQALTHRLQKRQMNERATLFRKLMKAYGPGVLEIVRENTIEETKNRLQEAELANRNLDAVMEILWNPSKDVLDFKVEAHTPEFLKITVTGCLFAEEMRKLGSSDIGFAFYCAYDYGFCAGLNPDIRFSRTKTLMEGDDCCNHTYHLASGDKNPSGGKP